MNRFNLKTILVVGCGIGLPIIALAQFRGPTAQPVTGNVPGVIWNASGTTAIQAGAQMDFTGTNFSTNPTFKSDFGMLNYKAIRVDRATSSTLNFGNWYPGGPFQFTADVYGGLRVLSVGASQVLGQDARVQADKFCFNPGGAANCITTWPSGSATSSLYVQKAGDAMTGALTIGSFSTPINTVSGGAIEVYADDGYGLYGSAVNAGSIGAAGFNTNGIGVYGSSNNERGVVGRGNNSGPGTTAPIAYLGTVAGIGVSGEGSYGGYFNGFNTGLYSLSATGTALHARVGNGGPTGAPAQGFSSAVVGRGLVNGGFFTGYQNGLQSYSATGTGVNVTVGNGGPSIPGMVIAPSTGVVGKGLENGGHFVGYENGIQAWSSTGTGVYGDSYGGTGIHGHSFGGTAIFGDGYDGAYGLYAVVTGDAGGIAAVYGGGDSNTIGVYGGGGTGVEGYGTTYGGDFTGEATGIIARSVIGGQAIITQGNVQINGGTSAEVSLNSNSTNAEWKARYALDRYSNSRAGGLWINASNSNTSWFAGAPYFNGTPTDDFMLGFDPTNPHNRSNFRMILTSAGVPRFSGLISCGTLGTSSNGTVTCSSDARLKDIKGSFTSGLEALAGIQPKAFSWKKDTDLYDGGVMNYGFIAQNVQKNLPEAVTMGSEGQLQVSLTPIVAASVNAINELKAENDDLRQKVEGLEERLEKLERQR